MGIIRISDAAHAALKDLAKTDGRTLTAVLDRLVLARVDPSPPPLRTPRPRPAPAGPVAGFTIEGTGIHCLPVEAICARCGHPVRKHTPKCYVMGCACRSVQA